ncbi:MAG: SPOR domain-containing protein [Bacteroidota bacterium]
MKSSPMLLLACTFAAAMSGCGSTEESTAEQPLPAPPPPHPASTAEPRRTLEFETRTDTVTAVHGSERSTPPIGGRIIQIRYMVQIGAFKDPHHASAVQALARQRYRMPVLNDYHAGLGLYQIRLGFFESRESARKFREQMLQAYPGEYKDSWVVQLKR